MTEGAHLLFNHRDAFVALQFPCGSEPARESAVAMNINGESAAAIAGKPAPTGTSVVFNDRIHYKFCGSWLASDVAIQATLASTDKAPSRAGSLQQGKAKPAYNNEIG
jgi:hypothetical protein